MKVIDRTAATRIRRGLAALDAFDLGSKADQRRAARVRLAMRLIDDQQAAAYSDMETALEQLRDGDVADAIALLEESCAKHARPCAKVAL